MLWAIGIEFALFWAILIAVLNYIPYVGSLIAVLFPVLLSLAQFGTLGMAGNHPDRAHLFADLRGFDP